VTRHQGRQSSLAPMATSAVYHSCRGRCSLAQLSNRLDEASQFARDLGCRPGWTDSLANDDGGGTAEVTRATPPRQSPAGTPVWRGSGVSTTRRAWRTPFVYGEPANAACRAGVGSRARPDRRASRHRRVCMNECEYHREMHLSLSRLNIRRVWYLRRMPTARPSINGRRCALGNDGGFSRVPRRIVSV
jgi:hypothetical protein